MERFAINQLKSNDVIQINAIIITGLLILLTIQTLNPQVRELDEIDQRIDDLRLETRMLFTLQDELRDDKEDVFSDEVKNTIQKQIDDVNFRYKETSVELDKLTDKRDELQLSKYRFTEITFSDMAKFASLIIIMPFSISSIVEILHHYDKKNVQKASDAGIMLMGIGFFLLFLGVIFMSIDLYFEIFR